MMLRTNENIFFTIQSIFINASVCFRHKCSKFNIENKHISWVWPTFQWIPLMSVKRCICYVKYNTTTSHITCYRSPYTKLCYYYRAILCVGTRLMVVCFFLLNICSNKKEIYQWIDALFYFQVWNVFQMY